MVLDPVSLANANTEQKLYLEIHNIKLLLSYQSKPHSKTFKSLNNNIQ